jgi:hypothetical protein
VNNNPHELHQRVVAAEAEDRAVAAHPLEVDRWSIRSGRQRAAEEEEEEEEDTVVHVPHHLQSIKGLGFLLGTFLPIYREVQVSWKNWISVF